MCPHGLRRVLRTSDSPTQDFVRMWKDLSACNLFPTDSSGKKNEALIF